MKIKYNKLSATGMTHLILPLIVVASVAVVGTLVLKATHAAPPPGGGGPGNVLAADIPVPADYNGDKKTDIAFWIPQTGTWNVSTNLSGATTLSTVWGTAGDMPVPADYNGDHKADFAVFRPSNGTWYVKGIETVQFGQSGDIPVPADYNGDGKADIAVYRPSTCKYYVSGIGSYQMLDPIICPSVTSTYVPTPANYLGTATGLTKQAAQPTVFGTQDSTTNREWLYVAPLAGLTTTQSFGPGGGHYGIAGDLPVPAKYVANSYNQANIAVWRPSNGTWYVAGTSTLYINGVSNPTTLTSVQWGQSGDIPVPADYNGNGTADYAVWRPSNATWYIKGIATVKYGNAY